MCFPLPLAIHNNISYSYGRCSLCDESAVKCQANKPTILSPPLPSRSLLSEIILNKFENNYEMFYPKVPVLFCGQLSRIVTCFIVSQTTKQCMHWWICCSTQLHSTMQEITYSITARCGLRGCKNGPAPFPGRMSYKATKPGLVCLSYLCMPYYCIVVY